MRALLVGGSGFIGSHLVAALVGRGHTVRVLDRAAPAGNVLPPAVDLRIADLADRFAVAEALQEIEIVIHAASASVPSTSNLDPVRDIESNLVSTVELLRAMVKADVSRILFLSSGGTVYGNPKQVPVPEEHPCNPICSYGIVKVAIEHYLEMFRELHGIESVVLRPANPYGPHQGHVGVQGVIATFLAKIAEGQPLVIWGDGSVERDFIYIDDLVALCVAAVERFAPGVYNAGSGEGHSIRTILEELRKVVASPFEVQFRPGRGFDVKRVVLDIQRAQQRFSWTPAVDLASGLGRYWNWMVERR